MKNNGRQKPGPGNYTPHHGFTMIKSESWVFGSEKRTGTMNKLVARNPGPGNYNIPSHTTVGPKYYMGVKFDNDESIKRAKN